MHSCIYLGQVHHQRYTPAEHRFRYGLYMLYLDLDEVPLLLDDGLLRQGRFAPLAFRRDDHLGGPEPTLSEAVRGLVQQRIGKRPAGPIRLLTGLRCFGYYFSPLNLYYCFDADAIETVVAEVSNTPWRETHYYVLSEDNRIGEPGELHFSHPKGFHVSPFMDMDVQYEWKIGLPGSQLSVQIANRLNGQRVFEADLGLARRELGRRQLLGLMMRYPFMTGRVAQAIYYQAFRLWRKKCPFYSHPKHRDLSATEP